MQLGTHKSDSLACLTTSALVCKFPLPHDVKDSLQSTLEAKNKLCSMQKKSCQELLTHRVPTPYKIYKHLVALEESGHTNHRSSD